MTKKVELPNKVVTQEEASQKVKELFDENFDVKNPILGIDSVKMKIADYVSTLTYEVKDSLLESYYSLFVDACKNEATESALELGWITLVLERKGDENVVYEVLSTLYGDNGEKENLEYTLSLFDSFSTLKDNMYTQKIDELKSKYDEVIHPKTFEETIVGRWISIDNFQSNSLRFNTRLTAKFNLPHFIIDVANVGVYNGATLVYAPSLGYNVSSARKLWQQRYGGYDGQQLRLSQDLYVDGKEQSAMFRFASEKINEAKTEMAIAGHESNRQFEAEAKAKIWSSKEGNFGEKLGADVLTTVYVGLADAIFDAMAVGSKRVEAYAINLSNPTSSTIDAIIAYQNVKEKTTGERIVTDDVTSINHFVKWEESDSVIFISQEGKPIFAGLSLSKDSPLLDEYKAIKKKHNLWKPKYLIPCLAGLGVGGYCLGQSISWMIDDINDKTKSSASAKTIVLASVGGGIIGGVLGYILDGKMSFGRRAAYMKLNKQSLDKMRKKAAEMHLQPEYDPFNNSISMGASINF